MKYIRVLIIEQSINYPITDGLVEKMKYSSRDTLIDLLARIEYDGDYGTCYIDTSFENYLFACYSHMMGVIDWNLDVLYIPVSSILRSTKKDFLIVNSKGGTGSTGGEMLMAIIFGVLSNVIYNICAKLFSKIITKKGAIRIMENESGKTFNDIKRTITFFNEWPVGFISKKRFNNQGRVETVIMKSLGYEKKKNKWISN